MPATADKTKLPASVPDAGNTFAADLVIDQALAVNYEGGAAAFIDGLAANCTDLRVFSDDTLTEVAFGVKQFSQTPGSRKLILGLGIPSTYPLSSAADTTYRLYRGCVGGTFESKSGVVPTADGFVLAYSMEEASGNLLDWTANGFHGTPRNLTYGVAGAVGLAVRCNGSNTRVAAADYEPPSPFSGFTVMLWYKGDNPNAGAQANYGVLAQKWAGEGAGAGWEIRCNGSYGVQAIVNVGGVIQWAVASRMDNTWRHAALTWDGTQWRFYDGGAVVGSAQTKGSAANDDAFWLGENTPWNTKFDGDLDSLLIASAARSANWITSYYNMTSNNGAFWTVGAEVPLAVSGSRLFHPRINPGLNPRLY